jgi:hypothetical protein
MAKQMSFGDALQHLKSGQKVCRAGWNGKGMWLALQKGYPEGVPANKNTSEAFGVPEGSTVRILPYIAMKTVDGAFVPWLASQTDVLAEDWQLA